MTPLQWRIVEAAYYNKAYTHHKVAKDAITAMFNAGPESEVPKENVLWLNDVGKRYGLVPWDSPEEEQKFWRNHHSGSFLPAWKRDWLKKKRQSGGSSGSRSSGSGRRRRF